MGVTGSAAITWADVHSVRMIRHLLAPAAGAAPVPADPVAVADRVAGLQAQVDGTPALSVLARDHGVDGGAAPARLRRHRGWLTLVRVWAMRGTVHLVPDSDVHLYAAALGDSIAAGQTRLWPRHGVPADAEDKLTDAMREALADGPLHRRSLAQRVGDRLGDAYRVLLEHPWGIGLKPAVARGLLRLDGSGPGLVISLPDERAAARIGTVAAADAQCWLAGRYLAANVVGSGPSFAGWAGLPAAAARAAIGAAADGGVRIGGRRYATVGALEPTADPGAVALVPSFDPYTLAVADKDGFCPPGTRKLVYRTGGWVSATIVLAGVPAGVWKLTGQRTRRVTTAPFTALDPATTRAVADHAARIESYLAAATGSGRV
jgi:Winged helix DNA-binding domain